MSLLELLLLAAALAALVGVCLAIGLAAGVGLSIYGASRIVAFLERKGLLP